MAEESKEIEVPSLETLTKWSKTKNGCVSMKTYIPQVLKPDAVDFDIVKLYADKKLYSLKDAQRANNAEAAILRIGNGRRFDPSLGDKNFWAQIALRRPVDFGRNLQGLANKRRFDVIEPNVFQHSYIRDKILERPEHYVPLFQKYKQEIADACGHHDMETIVLSPISTGIPESLYHILKMVAENVGSLDYVPPVGLFTQPSHSVSLDYLEELFRLVMPAGTPIEKFYGFIVMCSIPEYAGNVERIRQHVKRVNRMGPRWIIYAKKHGLRDKFPSSLTMYSKIFKFPEALECLDEPFNLDCLPIWADYPIAFRWVVRKLFIIDYPDDEKKSQFKGLYMARTRFLDNALWHVLSVLKLSYAKNRLADFCSIINNATDKQIKSYAQVVINLISSFVEDYKNNMGVEQHNSRAAAFMPILTWCPALRRMVEVVHPQDECRLVVYNWLYGHMDDGTRILRMLLKETHRVNPNPDVIPRDSPWFKMSRVPYFDPNLFEGVLKFI